MGYCGEGFERDRGLYPLLLAVADVFAKVPFLALLTRACGLLQEALIVRLRYLREVGIEWNEVGRRGLKLSGG